MVQETRGHTPPFVIGNLRKFPFGAVCPFFSTAKSTHQPDEPSFFCLLIPSFFIRKESVDTDEEVTRTRASKISITLHKVPHGNFKSHPIDEDEFWK
jgi:hypothetical protein